MHPDRTNKGDCTIETIGEGKIVVAPDRAVITLGAIQEGEQLGSIQGDNAAAIKAVTRALEENGIARSDIGTADYRIEPQYDYEDGKAQFRGYQIVHLLHVTIVDIAVVGKALDEAVAAGANTISQIAFESSESAQAKQAALRQAVSNANEKAAAIAQTLGVSLSSVPCGVEELVRLAGNGPAMFKTALPMGDAATVIEPGGLIFTASVRAWYMFA